MPTRCCVPQCDNRSDGHGFPHDPDLFLQWQIAIRREDPQTRKLWKPTPYSVVCRSHFVDSDYKPSETGKRRRLQPRAVPSVFAFNRSCRRSYCKRQISNVSADDVPQIGRELIIGDTTDEPDNDAASECCESDVGIQCSILLDSSSRLSINHFKENEKAVSYYTGFDDYQHFMYFFFILGPAVHHLNYQCFLLSHEDQLFLTLFKFRQARDDFDLSMQFKVSESTIARLIVTWTNFLYFQLSEIVIWPSQSTIHDTMPESFKDRFPSTRVILDATEIPICKPSNVNDQKATFSRYKNRNTLKTMIGCSPRGLVTYVSDSYGGATSDRQIIERSHLLMPRVFKSGDSIMADRGIMVQDLFSSLDVKVNTPTMLKGRSQLEPNEVVHDRRIASKRIHIERVIGLGKTYKILKRELHPSKVPMGSRIIHICYMLSNFRQSIVNRLA